MKKHLLTVGKAIGFLALLVAGISICSLPAFDIQPFLEKNAALLRLWRELVPLFFTLLSSFVFIRLIEKDKLKINTFVKPLRDCVLGIVLGCLWIGAVASILSSIGIVHFEIKNAVSNIGIWILAVLLNVIMQEYLVRGYLFQLLKEKYSSIFAVVATTILFTVLHGGAFEAGIIAVLNVVTMSVFVSLLLVHTKNLLASILVHFIWNMAGGFILGAGSMAGSYPSIWKATFTGNGLISGGSAKIEGSIITLAINSLLIAGVAFLLAKEKGKNATV